MDQPLEELPNDHSRGSGRVYSLGPNGFEVVILFSHQFPFIALIGLLKIVAKDGIQILAASLGNCRVASPPWGNC